MKEELRNLVSELKNVRTIDLASVSRTVLEKFFWMIIGILGIGWAIYFLPNQFELWPNNPSIISLKDVPLSEIPYPSISILPQGITKYAIAERLGNYVLSDRLPEKFKRLREILFDHFTKVYGNDEYLKKLFIEECLESDSRLNCQVCN